MVLDGGGYLALIGENISQEAEKSIPGCSYVLVDIFLLLVNARNNHSKMIVILRDLNLVTIQRPEANLTIVLNVIHGTCHYNPCLICSKNKPVPLSVVTYNIYKPLQAPGVTRQDVSIICYTYCRNADWSDIETQTGGVRGGQTRVDVSFKMARSPLVALAGSTEGKAALPSKLTP